MEQNVKKLLKAVLTINLVSAAIGFTVYLFLGTVYGLIAFGASLIPVAIVIHRMNTVSEQN